MDRDTPGLPAWDLIPETATRLAEAVDDLHTATGQPRHEILAAIVAAGLDRREENQARLAERHLADVIAGLPPDTRPAPDLTAYDNLLARRPAAGRAVTGSHAPATAAARAPGKPEPEVAASSSR